MRDCDWCGEPFTEGERQFPGYEDEPTHKACVRDAKRAYRYDLIRKYGEPPEQEREPFTDWPNGQGTYD